MKNLNPLGWGFLLSRTRKAWRDLLDMIGRKPHRRAGFFLPAIIRKFTRIDLSQPAQSINQSEVQFCEITIED